MNTNYETRGQWLAEAAKEARTWFTKAGMDVPRLNLGIALTPENVAGQCWPRSASPRGVNMIRLSPLVNTGPWALTVLVHEMVHAWDDCASDHGHAFTLGASRIGLTGNLLIPQANLPLSMRIMELSNRLGALPNG